MSEEHVSVFCFEFYHEKAETLYLGLFLLDFMIIVFSLWAHGCYTIHVFDLTEQTPMNLYGLAWLETFAAKGYECTREWREMMQIMVSNIHL